MSHTTNRKKSRKLLYQILFSKTFQEIDLEKFYDSFYSNAFTYKKDDAYINEMLKVVSYREGFFLYVIQKFSPRFDISSMNVANVIPLYIALAEMFYLTEEIPAKVSINEAVEVAKVYGGDASKKIVNGVLNSVLKNIDELENTKQDFE